MARSTVALSAMALLLSLSPVNSANPAGICQPLVPLSQASVTENTNESVTDLICASSNSNGTTGAVTVSDGQVVVSDANGVRTVSAGTADDPLIGVQQQQGTSVVPFIENNPSAIRLALAGPHGMSVGWSTIVAYNTAPTLLYGTTNPPTHLAVGRSQTYGVAADVPNFHYVQLYELQPKTVYYYQILGDSTTTPVGGPSSVLQFTTAPVVGSTEPFTFGLVGDMGLANTFDTRNALVHATEQKEWDLFVHIGDISYADDFYNRIGATYEGSFNQWQTWMEPVTSAVAYMTQPGNHEAACNEGLPQLCPLYEQNFIPYQNRFRMPSDESGAFSNSMWYSYDYANTHFVMISSETDFPGSYEGPSSLFRTPDIGGVNGVPTQLQWLEADLAAVNRTLTPWLIVTGHRNLYTATYDLLQQPAPHNALRDAFEPLFLKHQVDMYISGHIHYYERDYPINNGTVTQYNYDNMTTATAPIYIVNGAAGSDEGHNPVLLSPNTEAALINYDSYGYSKMQIINSSTARWQFIAATTGDVIDDIYFVRARPAAAAAAAATTTSSVVTAAATTAATAAVSPTSISTSAAASTSTGMGVSAIATTAPAATTSATLPSAAGALATHSGAHSSSGNSNSAAFIAAAFAVATALAA